MNTIMDKSSHKGVVACGHEKTAEAAKQILEIGGNAYDAVLAAHFAACLAEPVLSSLGGGGFLTAHTKEHKSMVYDFFTQTPLQKNTQDPDFFSIAIDFGGGITQDFHIGNGSIATPGCIKGIFQIHKDLCSLPMSEIIKPAVGFARNGIKINKLQSYIFELLTPIYRSNKNILSLYESPNSKGNLITEKEVLRNPELADFLEELAKKGDRLFYEGEIAEKIHDDSKKRGGHITKKDLKNYKVIKREPLEFDYKGSRFITNPPPSSGGILIAFSLALAEGLGVSKNKFGSFKHLKLLTEVMEKTNDARKGKLDDHLFNKEIIGKFLDPSLIKKYQEEISQTINKLGNTTHMSVIDSSGNIASMTVTNGEGSGYVVPGTGIVLNNMLGEEDLNPHGFGNWPENKRISSMMAPSILLGKDGTHYALGSGGSNRIRTAILQFVLNATGFDMSLHDAVQNPRIHFEKGDLNMEAEFEQSELNKLKKLFPKLQEWKGKNMFFGGVHTVARNTKTGHLEGVGDERRGGTSIII